MKNSRNTLVNTNEVKHKHELQMKIHEVKIMKTLNRRPPGLFKKALGITAGIFLFSILMPGTASATTAANAVITNTATVNYDDSGGNPQVAIQAVASVTVNLVTAHPTLGAPIDASVASGVALDYTYTITNNSNGPDAYALTAADNLPQAGITSQAHIFRDAGDTSDIGSITLGATSAAAVAIIGATSITVPNDGTVGGGINGIIVGETLVVGVDTLLVSAITDTGAGTDLITFATTPLTAAVSVGDQIGEQGTFISRTTPIATVNNSTYIITVTADDGVTAGAAPTDDATTTVLVIDLTVTKYVANTTAVSVGGGSTITVDTGLGAGSITYYSTGVTGNPGHVLEYVIGIANAAASAAATDVVISDPVPNFTTQTGNIALDPGTGTWSNVATTADNGDFAEVVGATVFIYAGTGGDDTVGGGSLAVSTTTLGAFRVTITP